MTAICVWPPSRTGARQRRCRVVTTAGRVVMADVTLSLRGAGGDVRQAGYHRGSREGGVLRRGRDPDARADAGCGAPRRRGRAVVRVVWTPSVCCRAGHGVWIMEYGSWSMDNGAWGMGHGAWGMGHGAWSMEHGAWGMDHGAWGMGVLRSVRMMRRMWCVSYAVHGAHVPVARHR
jgi:hypothetical protein